MSWFADLAGKAEDLLINLDEQTGAALRNQNVLTKPKKHDCIRNEFANTQKKRPIPRSIKSVASRKPSATLSVLPTRCRDPPMKPSPTQSVLTSHSKDFQSPTKVPKQKSPKKYNLNHCPRTMVVDVKDEDLLEYGYKPRRFSLPADLGEISDEVWVHRLENLEVENAMLKNELNVTNREIKELIDRLHLTEAELAKTNLNLENTDTDFRKVKNDRETLIKQIEQLKSQLSSLTNSEITKHREQMSELQSEISVLRARNEDLEELVKLCDKQDKEKEVDHNKTENDLRHAHSMINVLHSDLNKSKDECKRLEKEWESYKLRVKNMLASKDKEIKALQQGVNLTEDTKILVDEIENLKEEREVLSEAVNRVRGECGDMKQYVETLESRHGATERVVLALRDALKEERAGRIKAEASFDNLAQELKSVQIETGETIANLREALREKEKELSGIRESTVSSLMTDSSALNVADFDANNSEHSDDNEKFDYLTQKLIQRQAQIDLLMADNNTLKIQLEKLESKYKTDMKFAWGNGHSVVSLQDGGHRLRPSHNSISLTNKVSHWFKMLIRTHPLFRVFVVMYMVCLHIWVFAVLLTNTPDTKGYYYYKPQMLNPN